MTLYRFGDVVRARFPHVERAVTVMRPSVVLASWPTPVGDLLWVAMVTNADRAAWPGDVMIDDALELGLIIPSKVRTAKVATVAADSASKIAVLSGRALGMVRERMVEKFGVA